MENMLTVEEVADILKVKPITVRQMYREKRLRAFKIGKAWRTTQSILEEDIACLSRGEKPPELPPQAAFGPTAKPGVKRGRKPRAAQEPVPAPAPAAPVVREEPAPAPAVEAAAPAAVEEPQDAPPADEDAPKERRRRQKAQEPQDDGQPLLF
ncbi:MAG TPA: helix-turn-helix domain-containing protein [Candidatus Hydrogenedentes bacterium]|nr:helix-turn-helix domain-containing protein [Candidatus Hydrogenedentota bacterium]